MLEFDNERLRPMTAEDLDQVLAWRNHPEVRAVMFVQQEISFEDHSKWFARAHEDKRKHLLVFEVAGIPSGFVNIAEQAHGRVADWGFYKAPDAAKGVGRRLGQAALAYAFDTLGLHKICGQVLSYNERSVQFHASLGFCQEGILRDQYFDSRCYHDVICFGLLQSEWQPGLWKDKK
jgi:UDP-4-amino-4,6-dideoxy-N-acetyl-beta-L-altrosamine N-acetyltransferase